MCSGVAIYMRRVKVIAFSPDRELTSAGAQNDLNCIMREEERERTILLFLQCDVVKYSQVWSGSEEFQYKIKLQLRSSA